MQREPKTQVCKTLSIYGLMLKHQPEKSLAMAPLQSHQNTLTLKLSKSYSILISEVISRDILCLNARDCRQVHLQLSFFNTCRHQQKVSHTVSRCPARLQKAQRTQHHPEVAKEGAHQRGRWPVNCCKGSLSHLFFPKIQLETYSKY